MRFTGPDSKTIIVFYFFYKKKNIPNGRTTIPMAEKESCRQIIIMIIIIILFWACEGGRSYFPVVEDGVETGASFGGVVSSNFQFD